MVHNRCKCKRHTARWLLLIVLILLLGWCGWKKEHDAAVTVDAKYRQTVAINDSLSARLATTSLERDDYKSFADAERELHGRLVAGVRLHVAKRDTLVIHDRVPTIVQGDSTRRATFRDSTFAGIIEGTVTAPPCCFDLAVSYNLTRPEFNPAVGFIQVGNQFVATVEWGGEHVEVKSPYFQPVAVRHAHAHLKPLAPYAEAGAMFGGLGLAMGTQAQLGRGWSIVGGVDRVYGRQQTVVTRYHTESVNWINQYHWNIDQRDWVNYDRSRDVETRGRLTIRKEWR